MKPTIYIHHDAYSLRGKHLKTVDAQHKKENYPISELGYYAFYQYFIEKDGISIGLAGNFNRHFPPMAQLASLNNLYSELKLKYHLTPLNIKEHRNYQKTACPGYRIPNMFFAFYFNEIINEGWKKTLYTAILNMIFVVRY